ncbi:MAG TPA: ABC transporter ATP-binding protein [Kiritimatiellia bacterium]
MGKSYLTAVDRVDVLHGVDLRVRRGEFIGITGPSGSGKSTLLNLAALLDQPTAGTLRLDGEDISGLDADQLCERRKTKIGMVFQQFCLLPGRSARDNVAFRFRYTGCPRGEALERADATLRQLGLASLADRPARLLSGGEMQRVAIARAVALRPALLAADEPTGNLDHTAATAVLESFRRMNEEGLTILLVTHNEALLAYCTRHLVCRNGALESA